MSVVSLSNRLSALPISAVRKLVPFAQKAKAQSVKVLHLNIGDPDIKTPHVMLSRLKSFKENPISYAPSVGVPAFIEALKTYYHRLGYTFLESENIIATVGGSEALSMSFFATCEAGDEVLVFEPFYSNYQTIALLNGVRLVAVPTNISNGFHLPDTKTIEASITKKTKAILISNPCNPTGVVYTQKEIDQLVRLATKYGLFLISDEVYREFIFVDRPHASLFPYMKKHSGNMIVVDSLSKRYSLCGARLGVFSTLNKALLVGVSKIAMSRLSGGLIDQAVGAELTGIPEKYLDHVQEEYKKRRDVLFEGLSRIPGVTITKPEGAFYCMVGLPVTNAEDFCIWLLEKFRDANETVMLAPGAGFYKTAGKGTNEVRIAYVLNVKKLKRAIKIFAHALAAYPRRRKTP